MSKYQRRNTIAHEGRILDLYDLVVRNFEGAIQAFVINPALECILDSVPVKYTTTNGEKYPYVRVSWLSPRDRAACEEVGLKKVYLKTAFLG